MKNRTIIVLVLLMGIVMPVLAQNKKVEDRIQLARDKYAEGLALIEANSGEQYPLNFTTVVREQNWAAIGPKTEKMQFYYNEIEDEDYYYPVGYALRMVRYTYNQTVRNHLEEYLFDDNGNPLFYFTRFTEVINEDEYDFPIYHNAEDDLPVFEIRQYFDENGDIIRSIYKMLDESGNMKEITKSQSKIIEEIDISSTNASSFLYFKQIFDAIY